MGHGRAFGVEFVALAVMPVLALLKHVDLIIRDDSIDL